MTSVMSMKIGNAIGATIAVAIGGSMLLVGSMLLYKSGSIAIPMVVGSWSYHAEKRVSKDPITSEVIAIRDKWFRIECGDYFDKSYVYRKVMMRDRSWCEDPKYVDQLK
ncbi:hypothetical protein G6L37_02815 [Agrobacterium rubi]|nr:hypothetical protein [Agrobacterium rubi]NTF24313.1 hypothetical protein [Agrobacterium rubi]